MDSVRRLFLVDARTLSGATELGTEPEPNPEPELNRNPNRNGNRNRNLVVGEGAMAKVYVISCRDAGVECDFEARGDTLDEVMQKCADHGISAHNMKGFGPDLYLKMRRCVKVIDEG